MILVLRYIYLPGSMCGSSFASASIKEKEKGSDFSNKAGFLQTCSFILFFLLKLLAACSLVVTTVSWDG